MAINPVTDTLRGWGKGVAGAANKAKDVPKKVLAPSKTAKRIGKAVRRTSGYYNNTKRVVNHRRIEGQNLETSPDTGNVWGGKLNG